MPATSRWTYSVVRPSRLNSPQLDAVVQCAGAAQGIRLLQGPPGTGKTADPPPGNSPLLESLLHFGARALELRLTFLKQAGLVLKRADELGRPKRPQVEALLREFGCVHPGPPPGPEP